MRVSLLALAGILIVVPLFAYGEEPAGGKILKSNPHGQDGRCEVCHVASAADLNSWFTFSSTKTKMRADLNTICRDCHGMQFGHGIGKWSRLNRENLPYDEEGKIACAVTCHNMHVETSDPAQKRYFLRTTQIRLCLSCHNR